jgi:hypothetical protein
MANNLKISEETTNLLLKFFTNGFRSITALKKSIAARMAYEADVMARYKQPKSLSIFIDANPLKKIVGDVEELKNYSPMRDILEVEAALWAKLKDAAEKGDEGKVKLIFANITSTLREELALLPKGTDEKSLQEFFQIYMQAVEKRAMKRRVA